MVVKRVTAGPIHELDIGIGQLFAVERERLPWFRQQVGDTSNRDVVRHRVGALGKRCDAERQRVTPREPIVVDAAVAVTNT